MSFGVLRDVFLKQACDWQHIYMLFGAILYDDCDFLRERDKHKVMRQYVSPFLSIYKFS